MVQSLTHTLCNAMAGESVQQAQVKYKEAQAVGDWDLLRRQRRRRGYFFAVSAYFKFDCDPEFSAYPSFRVIE